MTALPASALDCAPRWATRRTDRATYGAKVAEIAETLGTPLQPWQQLVADTALEVDPATGLLVYREVRLTVPRQSGKTTLLLGVMLCRALAMGARQRITYTAQTGSDARTKWQDDWLPVLERSAFSRAIKPRLTNGHEALLFSNGSMQGLMAGTKKAGHGASLDLAMIDEAFAQVDARLEQAVKPAMITRPEPQLWVVSTAGTPEDSPYLWEKVQNGRARAESGATDAIAYFEWSAADDMDPADPATWWACMPALGHTVTQQAVAADFASMALNEFERAYLNRWKAGRSDPVIPLTVWADCLDDRSSPQDPVVFAFDVAPDRASASVAVCGPRYDGLVHVEVVEHRKGTEWLPGRVAELVDRWHPVAVVCDPGGPAGSLVPDVERSGVKVTGISATEHAKACGAFYDAVLSGGIRHRDDPALVTALDGAKKRTLGDAWAWSRRSTTLDISPLVAVTLAAWGLTVSQSAAIDVSANIW